MTRSKALFGITIITLAACQTEGEAPLTPGAEMRAQLPPISAEVLERHVATLSDDSFEGRAPGTAGGRETRDYLAKEMKRIGLEPLGDSYEHEVTLVSRTLDADQSNARIDLGRGFDTLSYGPEAVYWTKRDDTRISLKDSPLVFVGHGVVAPEYGWNDYAGLDARGKTVVMLINDPGFRAEGADFKGRAMTYYGRWTYKFEEAARQGADAAIIIHQTEPASYGWGVVSGSWSGPQLNLPRNPNDTEPVSLEGWVTTEQAEALFDSAGLDFGEMEQAASAKGFTPVSMGNLTLSAEIFQSLNLTESANVAGVLPGKKRPEEYILYTAHWDHLGVDQELVAEGKDGIFNGAVDNTTGTGGILAMAESWVTAGIQPDRSHLFVAVTAEESGLLGSQAFASNSPVPLSQIVGGLNIDGFLPLGRTKDLTVMGFGSSELEDILRDVAAEQGVSLTPDPSPEAGYFYRSDHIEFAKRGVPMLYVAPGENLVKGGIAAGKAAADAYRAGPYHNVTDEYDPDTWTFDGMVQTMTILRDVGVELSESNVRPNWYEGSEFRAARDAQLRDETQR
ncbi:MAG: M28 family peptidase [Parvularculaceae bacterium]|nr:M28 family peptidase [Parvularculaceae bacterium]